jgi:acyl-CoA synthetase (NDP forming)
MEYLAVCPHTKVIALYIEGIKRGKDFVEVAKTITPHKPIVACYVGGTETGKRAGFSHTGAMAGPDRLYDGLFRQTGVIRAHSITELFDFCSVLGTLPMPKSNKMILLTHSGGPGAAAADACGRVGLEMPPLSDETMERMAPFLPHTATGNNPIDLTFHKDPLHYFSEIPKILLEEKNADILLSYYLLPPHKVKLALETMGIPEEKVQEETNKVIDSIVEAVVRQVENQDKPVVGYTFRSVDEPLPKKLIGRGIPVFPEPVRAARAIKALVEYSRYIEETRG